METAEFIPVKLAAGSPRKPVRKQENCRSRRSLQIRSRIGSNRAVLGLAWALAAMLLLHPCHTLAAEEIQYRLKWIYNASVIGGLYARHHGMFRQQGLQVNVKEGGPERDAVRELEMGRAQFGVASADQVIRALAKGADVVVIAQLFQANPLQWIYRPDVMTLTGPADLEGKTLGVTFGGNDETILRALLAVAGLTESDVDLYSVRYDYTPFYRRQVNFWPVYRNTQAVFLGEKLQAAGEDYAFFNPADYGVRFVANSVVTSRKILETRPKLVGRFVDALLRGWQTALNPGNIEKAVATLQHYDRDSAADTLRRQIMHTRELVQPERSVSIGGIDVAAWKQTEQIMRSQALIPAPVDVEKVLVTTWTNRPATAE